MIRCFASDLDGTLLDSNGSFSKKTIQMIEYLKNSGITIIIASGRTDYEIIQMIKPLNLQDYEHAYIISYNGVKTTHLRSLSVLDEIFLTHEDASEIIDMLNKSSLKIHAFSKDVIYTSIDLEYHLHNAFMSKIKVKEVNMKHWKVRVPLYKILVYEEESILNEYKRKVHLENINKFNIFKSHPRLLEFVALDGTKGDAIKRLSEKLSIKPEEIIAFGDEENDITMLRYAGIGVAMANAKSNVKAIADLVTLSNDFDGVAEVVNYYMFKKETLK